MAEAGDALCAACITPGMVLVVLVPNNATIVNQDLSGSYLGMSISARTTVPLLLALSTGLRRQRPLAQI